MKLRKHIHDSKEPFSNYPNPQAHENHLARLACNSVPATPFCLSTMLAQECLHVSWVSGCQRCGTVLKYPEALKLRVTASDGFRVF